ncbi:MAG: FlgD immunoglobulin-like domain containing protein, partial [Bacteroidota bacterium]
ADIALEIRDLQGRRIRRVWSGKQAAGQYHARWDLRTDQGARVARGLYVAALTIGSRRVSAKFVVE